MRLYCVRQPYHSSQAGPLPTGSAWWHFDVASTIQYRAVLTFVILYVNRSPYTHTPLQEVVQTAANVTLSL